MGADRETTHDTTVMKVASAHSPKSKRGETYLASGVRVAMRLWTHERPGPQPETERTYEVVGYVLEGRAKLHLEGQTLLLEKGDSWTVPRGARHSYEILEAFTAVEATSPPAHVHGRDLG